MSIKLNEMVDGQLLETRKFSFPNGGHSVRKLSIALRELGDTMVSLKVMNGQRENRYGETTYEVSFVEDTKWGKVNASKLADKILTLGTRFTLDMSAGYAQLKFKTNFSDIMANPKEYGVA